jgi:hypothetical protein
MPAETSAAPAQYERQNSVAENADNIINNHEQNAAFFEHAERQIAPEPPRFEAVKPEQLLDLYEPDQLFELSPDEAVTEFAERPEQARPELTKAQYYDMAYRYVSPTEQVRDITKMTTSVIAERDLAA